MEWLPLLVTWITEPILIRRDHRNLVTRNRLPSGRRNARRDRKRLPQKTQVNLRQSVYLRMNGSNNHLHVLVSPLRCQLNCAFRHNNGAHLTKWLTGK
jgi:hypothetical protein